MFVRVQCLGTSPGDETSMEAAFSYLVTPDELATSKAQLLAAIGVNSARCARPVLRGEPAPGAALQDQLLLDAKDSAVGLSRGLAQHTRPTVLGHPDGPAA